MRWAWQFGKYGSVAVQSALADWAVFGALVWLGLGGVGAQSVSRLAGGVWSFAMNKFWAFESSEREHLPREARRFLVLYAFSYVLSLVLLATLETPIGTAPAKLVADGACFVVNFVAMRAWVFQTGSREEAPAAREGDAGVG